MGLKHVNCQKECIFVKRNGLPKKSIKAAKMDRTQRKMILCEQMVLQVKYSSRLSGQTKQH